MAPSEQRPADPTVTIAVTPGEPTAAVPGWVDPPPPSWPPASPAPPPYTPLPRPQPSRGRAAPVILGCVGVVIALVAGVLVWVLRSSGPSITASAAGEQATTGNFLRKSTTPTSDSAFATSTTESPATTAVSPSGLVRLDPSVSDPAAGTVLALLDRHFTAINTRDYAAWTTTVVSLRAQHEPVATWLRVYRSTQDQDVVVSAITETGPDSATVALAFVSTQDPVDAPAGLPVGRICWQARWPVEDLGAGGRIGTPARGTTTDSAC